MRCLVLLKSIPNTLHSADLRAFFASAVEAKPPIVGVFHFLHRRERGKETCQVLVGFNSLGKRDEFKREYNKKRWITESGEYCGGGLVEIDVFDGDVDQMHRNVKRELQPPPGLPRGNVGTPVWLLHAMTMQCVLPPHVLGRLGIKFRPAGKLSALPLDYGKPESPQEVDDAEEWEREEPKEQGEQVFEWEIEDTWDKHEASGIVMYTDELYWRVQLERDGRDEADSWDVDIEKADVKWELGKPEPLGKTRGAAMMKRMGWNGEPLGKDGQGLPRNLDAVDDMGGRVSRRAIGAEEDVQPLIGSAYDRREKGQGRFERSRSPPLPTLDTRKRRRGLEPIQDWFGGQQRGNHF